MLIVSDVARCSYWYISIYFYLSINLLYIYLGLLAMSDVVLVVLPGLEPVGGRCIGIRGQDSNH